MPRAASIHAVLGSRSITGSITIAASPSPASAAALSSAVMSSNGTAVKSSWAPLTVPGPSVYQSSHPKYPQPITFARPVCARAMRTAAGHTLRSALQKTHALGARYHIRQPFGDLDLEHVRKPRDVPPLRRLGDRERHRGLRVAQGDGAERHGAVDQLTPVGGPDAAAGRAQVVRRHLVVRVAVERGESLAPRGCPADDDFLGARAPIVLHHLFRTQLVFAHAGKKPQRGGSVKCAARARVRVARMTSIAMERIRSISRASGAAR